MANTTFQQGRKPKNTWLAGKIKCGHCGYALKATHVPNSTGYFRCTKRTENKGCPGCGKIRKEEFEQFIFSAMQEKFKDFQILHGREEKVNPKLTAYQVELAQVEAEIEKLLDTLTGANATLLAYANKKIEELDTRRQTISKAIAEYALKATHVPNSTGYFRCTKRTENKGCPGCGKIRKEEFEQFIFSAMQEKFKDFQILHGREEKVNPKLTAYQVELAQVEAEIEKLLDTLTGANATLLAYANKKIEELDTRRQTISKAIAELSVETISPQQIKKLSYYLDNWDSIDFDDKRKAADGLISTIAKKNLSNSFSRPCRKSSKTFRYSTAERKKSIRS